MSDSFAEMAKTINNLFVGKQKEVEDFESQDQKLQSLIESENFIEVRYLILEIDQPSGNIEKCLANIQKIHEEAPILIEKMKTAIAQKNFQDLASQAEQFETQKASLTNLGEQISKAQSQAISVESLAFKKFEKIQGPIQDKLTSSIQEAVQSSLETATKTQLKEQQKVLESQNAQILDQKDAIIKKLTEEVAALKVELQKEQEVVKKLNEQMPNLEELKKGVEKLVEKLCPVENPPAQP